MTPNPHLPSTPALTDGKTQRLQALRNPLSHCLAARPASTKLLSSHLKCKESEILEVLQKIGKKSRLDESKWDLTDKAYKELDIWSFDYPNEDDRGLAINRAISAFDRMRLSTKDPLWDKLQPRHERGKGKVLSQLNLHQGPLVQQVSTPKIKIQHSTEDSAEARALNDKNESKDRLSPGVAEPMARSKSHGSTERTKVSEKEAKSKSLLKNGPKKSKAVIKSKEPHPAAKKGSNKKANAPKSSEFVNDSDEDDGLEDQTDTPKTNEKLQGNTSQKPSEPPSSSDSTSSTKTASGIKGKAGKVTKPVAPTDKVKKSKMDVKSQGPSPKISQDSKPLPKASGTPNGVKKKVENANPARTKRDSGKKGNSSENSSPVHNSRVSDSSQSSTAMQKSLSRQRNTSSPHKPSPLGSSPPTNASDLETNVRSSNSSSPSKSSTVPVNGIVDGINGHANNTSEHSLKRKAGDMDSDIHNHSASQANNGINGVNHDNQTRAKRQKTSDIESPSSVSTDSPSVREIALQKAQDFQRYYAKYRKTYLEVSQMEDAPDEKVEDLMKLHHRLKEMKEQIMKALVEV